MNKLFFIYFIAVAFSAIVQQYDYIIVGAGWAGFGACSKLKAGGAANILVLQAKNRTGGRCTTFTYNGVEQDLGAAFIQQVELGNAIHDLFKVSGYNKTLAWFGNETEWYLNKSMVSDASSAAAQTQYNDFVSYLQNTAWRTNSDKSLDLTLNKYWMQTTLSDNGPASDVFLKAKVNQTLQTWGIDNGADLNTMSSWQYDGVFDYYGSTDYTVKPSYSNFFQYLYNSKCSGVQTNLGETVLRVDYSGSLINVTTDKNSYLTKKLFLSPSIGILQASLQNWTNASTISFNPALPTDKKTAINSIGFGRFEKLYVTFSSKFWDTTYSSTLNFICKTPPCNFTEAWVVPSIPNTILFWIGGSQATRLVQTNLSTIQAQLSYTLSQFLTTVPNITNIFMTNWWQDKNILGGYTYAKTGTTKTHFTNLRKVLKTTYTSSTGVKTTKNIWFIGEGTHPDYYSYSHGAYSSGVAAATAALIA